MDSPGNKVSTRSRCTPLVHRQPPLPHPGSPRAKCSCLLHSTPLICPSASQPCPEFPFLPPECHPLPCSHSLIDFQGIRATVLALDAQFCPCWRCRLGENLTSLSLSSDSDDGVTPKRLRPLDKCLMEGGQRVTFCCPFIKVRFPKAIHREKLCSQRDYGGGEPHTLSLGLKKPGLRVPTQRALTGQRWATRAPKTTTSLN